MNTLVLRLLLGNKIFYLKMMYLITYNKNNIKSSMIIILIVISKIYIFNIEMIDMIGLSIIVLYLCIRHIIFIPLVFTC